MGENRVDSQDPFLSSYQPSDLQIASEFLVNWLPFLSKDLCSDCTRILSDRVKSLDLGIDGNSKSETEEGGRHLLPNTSELHLNENEDNNHETNSLGSNQDEDETNSLGSWKDEAQGCFQTPQPTSSSTSPPVVETPTTHISWADMAQEEDELEEEDEQESSNRSVNVNASTGELMISTSTAKPKLSRDQREYIRFKNVVRNKDFLCFERVDGKLVNILQGLELHAGVFSAVEQKRIVDFVYQLQEKGKKGELKERTYSAPQKWMRGKGRVTIQFGCCYNYATDRNGNPPGILQDEMVDPIPHLFKVIIKRLVRWHVLPPTCVPDSCIVNIYEEGDCIPPHVDNHDFVRPFCTVSFLSECDIVFGSRLRVIRAGEFAGSFAIPLPVGSVLVLNGNGADVAKHCVPAVPKKRISITFRRMDESKRPKHYAPEPDLQDIQPLPYEVDRPKGLNLSRPDWNIWRQQARREPNIGSRSYPSSARGSMPSGLHYSVHNQRGPANRRRVKVNIDK